MPRTNFNAAGAGLSRLAAALGGASTARQDAYDREIDRQMKLEQGRAGIERDYAAGRKLEADALETQAKTGVLQSRPGLFEEQVAAASGVDIPMVRAVRQLIASGQAPEVPMGPPTEEGDMGVGQMPIAPEIRSNVARAIQQNLPLLANSGDLNPQQLANAAEVYRNMGLSDAIIAGTADRNRVGGAQAAASGKDLFSADSSGGVLDRFVGSLATDNPMAQSTIGLRGSQAAQAKAAAAENYAQAESARATAGLRREQTKNIGNGGGKAPSGYRWTTNLETGEPMMEPIPGGPADPSRQPPAKPMPATALKLQQEELDAIGLSGGISADLGALVKQIEAGDLKLGPVENLMSKGKNYAGMSDKNSRNFQSFIATLEKNRNDSLRLNKGVQTEGDAVRAWNEILANVNDEKVVVQRLREVQQLNERAAQLRRMNVDTIRANFGHPPLETDSRYNLPPAVGGDKKRPPPAKAQQQEAPAAGGGWKIERVQ